MKSAQKKPAAGRKRPLAAQQAPAPPYVRTADEEALVERIAYGNKPVSLVGEGRADGTLFMSTNHPDPQVGACQIMDAFGVTDSNLMQGLLLQLTQLATTKDVIDYQHLNSLLAYVRGIGPRDAIEAMHAVQMAAIHSAMMNTSRVFKGTELLDQFETTSASMNKLARTWTMQVETLKKHRSSGEQSIRVQHVTVAEGAQAIVGNGPMTLGGRGGASEKEHQPHEPLGWDAESTPLLSHVEAIRPALSGTGETRLERLPLSRSQGRSA